MARRRPDRPIALSHKKLVLQRIKSSDSTTRSLLLAIPDSGVVQAKMPAVPRHRRRLWRAIEETSAN